jgi:hypothetical protein
MADFCGFLRVSSEWVSCIAPIPALKVGAAATGRGVVPIVALIRYDQSAMDWAEAGHRRPLHAERDDMEEHIPLSGPIDLDALDDYLLSDHAPDDSMGLSDLDGFLTGIVVRS